MTASYDAAEFTSCLTQLRVIFHPLLSILLLLSFSTSASAESLSGQGPAAGTAIAAALETVGYHTQAQVLLQLREMLETLGALIYLGVIVSAVLTVSLLGNYRAALWMLVGPPLFVFASGIEMNGMKNQISASGTEWRFAQFKDFENRKDMLLNVETAGEPGQVSWLFHQYNILISEVSQRLIGIALNNDQKKQMLNMARQKTMGDTFGAEIGDGALVQLVQLFMGQCSAEIGAAHTIAIGNRDPLLRTAGQHYETAKKLYCEKFPLKDKSLPPGAAMNLVYNMGSMEHQSIDTQRHDDEQQHSETVVSCKQYWQWILEATRREALRILEDIQITNLDYYAWRNFGSDIYYQVIRDNFEKVTDEAEVTDRRKGPGDPCPQASGNEQSADSDITTDAGKLDAYAKILAGMMLRKQFAKAPVQDILQRAPLGTEFISPKESLPGSGATDPRTKKEMLERNKSEDFAAARKFEAFTLLHTLPYIQGFLLYALATTYPFFALFLLLPGRAGGFLMWMALWAWAKSWDVGWAAIMTADEILWNLLPQASFFNPHNPAPYSSPVSLLEGAYDGDPSYSLATYWLLVCTMITGVPIVTAQAIIGTKTALANILLKGSTGLSDRMGTYARNYMAAAQTGRHEQLMGQKQTLGMMRRSSSMFDAALRAGNATSKAGESGPVSATAKASAAPLVGGAQLTGGLATDFWGTIQGMAQSDPLADTQSNPTIDAAVKGLNQSVEANRESANRFGEDWLFRPVARLFPNSQFTRAHYQLGQDGLVTAGMVDTESAAKQAVYISQLFNLDPKNIPAELQGDPAAEEMYRALVAGQLKSAVQSAGHKTDQEILYYMAVPYTILTAGLTGLPGAYNTGKSAYMAGASLQDQVYGSEQEMRLHASRLLTAENQMAYYLAFSDPEVLEENLARSYVSLNRGAEWMAIPLFPQEALNSMETSEVTFNRNMEQRRGRADAAYWRWLLGPLP